jgi:hypothetical protein
MVGDGLGKSVAAGLDEFAKCIGRSVEREHLELARESLDVLKKKLAKAKRMRLVWFGLAALVMAAVSGALIILAWCPISWSSWSSQAR